MGKIIGVARGGGLVRVIFIVPNDTLSTVVVIVLT